MNLSYTTALLGTYLYERYIKEIKNSIYYRNYSDFDIGRFKKLDCNIDDKKLKKVYKFLKSTMISLLFAIVPDFFKYPILEKYYIKDGRSYYLANILSYYN